MSPASAGVCITVGAIDIKLRMYSYSNFGLCADLFAPGVDITSAGYDADTTDALLTGTSQAAPHVAGVMAQYLSVHPGAYAARSTIEPLQSCIDSELLTH